MGSLRDVKAILCYVKIEGLRISSIKKYKGLILSDCQYIMAIFFQALAGQQAIDHSKLSKCKIIFMDHGFFCKRYSNSFSKLMKVYLSAD